MVPCMNLLRRFFAWGRLAKNPPRHTAGRLVGPASVQRTQLGLREIDAESGVVTLRTGECRVVLTVSSVPLHHKSQDEARAFLTRWAAALNSLPSEAVWLMRSRPGGLEPALETRRARSTELARTSPGTGLARLVADQVAHLARLQDTGTARRNAGYVVVRGTRAAVLDAAEAARSGLARAGLTATILRNAGLARAIAESWQPGTVKEQWIYKVDFPASRERPIGLLYERGTPARVAV